MTQSLDWKLHINSNFHPYNSFKRQHYATFYLFTLPLHHFLFL
jgi:hypothetical protein